MQINSTASELWSTICSPVFMASHMKLGWRPSLEGAEVRKNCLMHLLAVLMHAPVFQSIQCTLFEAKNMHQNVFRTSALSSDGLHPNFIWLAIITGLRKCVKSCSDIAGSWVYWHKKHVKNAQRIVWNCSELGLTWTYIFYNTSKIHSFAQPARTVPQARCCKSPPPIKF